MSGSSNRTAPSRHFQRGAYYVEVLVAAVIIAASLGPAMEALRDGLAGQATAGAAGSQWTAVQTRMELVLAQPLSKLDAAATAAGGPTVPTTYSDAAGTPGRVLVYLSRYDGDNADADNNPFTGVDAGLIWVKVQVEAGTAVLTTLTAR